MARLPTENYYDVFMHIIEYECFTFFNKNVLTWDNLLTLHMGCWKDWIWWLLSSIIACIMTSGFFCWETWVSKKENDGQSNQWFWGYTPNGYISQIPQIQIWVSVFSISCLREIYLWQIRFFFFLVELRIPNSNSNSSSWYKQMECLS